MCAENSSFLKEGYQHLLLECIRRFGKETPEPEKEEQSPVSWLMPEKEKKSPVSWMVPGKEPELIESFQPVWKRAARKLAENYGTGGLRRGQNLSLIHIWSIFTPLFSAQCAAGCHRLYDRADGCCRSRRFLLSLWEVTETSSGLSTPCRRTAGQHRSASGGGRASGAGLPPDHRILRAAVSGRTD